MRFATSIARFRAHYFDDRASLDTTLAAARPLSPAPSAERAYTVKVVGPVHPLGPFTLICLRQTLGFHLEISAISLCL